jgi:hypothetical protein
MINSAQQFRALSCLFCTIVLQLADKRLCLAGEGKYLLFKLRQMRAQTLITAK